MPATFRIHFNDDIARAENLLIRSEQMSEAGEPERLCFDLRLSAVAMAVGALDAYLCDAYVDCLTAVLRAYAQNTWVGKLPSAYSKQLLPAGEILKATRQHRPLWRVRMAARKVMEKDNMLALSRIEDCFNGILPPNQKLWVALIPALTAHDLKRLTRHNANDMAGFAAGTPLQDAQKQVVAAVKVRIGKIVQFRHAWIHNCGRPKTAIIDLTHGRANARIRDIKLFITELDDHITAHRLA